MTRLPLDGAPRVLATRKSAVLFLRWVVIVTAGYLVLFAPASEPGNPPILLFVAVFLATNLLASVFPERWFDRTWLRASFVLFDTAWISLGMTLAGEATPELFLLYFSVLFIAALGESESMIAVGAALIGLLYLFSLLRTQPIETILVPAVLLRFPFLFGIATFYGYLVGVAKRERRAAEIAAERARARTDLLAALTHDVRTPLSSIVSLVSLLADREGEVEFSADERRAILEDVHRASIEALELVGSFLALASTEARTKAERRELVDLRGVAEDVLRHHRIAARAKGVELVERLAPMPPLVADPVQLGRAVSNLLSNAIKFAADGGRVEITCGHEGDDLVLEVADDGPGVPPSIREKLFQPYVSEAERSPGTGLGLFVVRLVAESHGGTVMLTPTEGAGARFVLRFPVQPVARAAMSSVRR